MSWAMSVCFLRFYASLRIFVYDKTGGADGFSLAVRDVITFRLDSCTDRRAAKFRSMSEFHRLFHGGLFCLYRDDSFVSLANL